MPEVLVRKLASLKAWASDSFRLQDRPSSNVLQQSSWAHRDSEPRQEEPDQTSRDLLGLVGTISGC